MITWDKAQRQRRESAETGRYSGIHMAVVLSLTVSLAVVVILSKSHVTNYLLVYLAAFAVPIPIALYFNHRIITLGIFPYAAALLMTLGAAVVFGI